MKNFKKAVVDHSFKHRKFLNVEPLAPPLYLEMSPSQHSMVITANSEHKKKKIIQLKVTEGSHPVLCPTNNRATVAMTRAADVKAKGTKIS